jgi:hypothetical protein
VTGNSAVYQIELMSLWISGHNVSILPEFDHYLAIYNFSTSHCSRLY